MYSVTVLWIAGFSLTAFATGATKRKAETQCNTVGWFGNNCQYQCHCAGSIPCNQDSGFCSSGCDSGWFGPACQYALKKYADGGGSVENIRWLTDMDEKTSGTKTRTYNNLWILVLHPPIPLTWIRVAVNHGAKLDDIQLQYRVQNNDTRVSCQSLSTAKVDDKTYDLVCETGAVVNLFYLEGTSVDNIRNIFVSKGRNVALKQTARQSSKIYVDRWEASNAVDGKLDIPDNQTSQEATCTHTRSKTQISPQNFRGSWTVTFSPSVDVLMMRIYNRRNPRSKRCCERRLENFELTVTARSNDKTTIPFKHIDTHPTPQNVYAVIPTMMISNVTEVKIQSGQNQTEGILTLCEVEIFGEIRCPTGRFGLACDRQCNCLNKTNCFIHSGGCPAGCALGYTGGDCHPCSKNKYGAGCKETCSEHCVKKRGKICHHVNGRCVDGCDPGYYGQKCEQKCSATCGGDRSCNRSSAYCTEGCEPGYSGGQCNAECEKTTWGENCNQTCNSMCQDSFCHHVNGSCEECMSGYQGDFCEQECNATTYGLRCNKTCSINCLSSRCHHVAGACHACPKNRTGDFCESMKMDKNESINVSRTLSVLAYIIPAIFCCLVSIACFLVYRCYKQRSERARQKEQNDNEIQLNEIPDKCDSANLPPLAARNGAKSERNFLKRVQLPLSLSLRGAFGPKSNAGESDRTSVVASTSEANAPEGGNTAISVEDLKNYISQHSTDSHFEEEFLSVPKTNDTPQIYGNMPDNVKKNRFKNIIPYDTTRVQLQAKAGKKHSDYINASYIKDFKGNKAFIASQGPTEVILNDFVRMLWERKVDKVVMLTNLIEQGKKKCCMYWPVDGEEQFGDVAVTLFTTHVFAEYTIRHLHLSKNGEPSQDLTHFHFTAWPDHSVPDSPWGLVDLYQRVIAVPGDGPVLVHCSAGVGRTGTFIGLCNLLKEAEVTGKMDFRSTLWKLRQDRMHTIQTLDQYIYLHRVAIVGYMVAGTTIEVKDMYCRLDSLESEKGGIKSTRNYKQEFEALVEVFNATKGEQMESPFEEQRKNVYQNLEDTNIVKKDRLSYILPNSSYRPDLTPETLHEDTYINAVLVPNLIKDRHDILTQLPLPSTVTDFWRLVIQYDVGLVVAFDTDLKQTDETIGDFLPSSEAEPFESERFKIETKAPVESRLVTEFSLSVQQKVLSDMDSSTPQTKTVTFLLCKNTQMDPVSVLEILEQIQACRSMSSKQTVYMCRNGADKCGLVCIQSILLDRMKLDQCLTVPLVVGKIKTIRPQVIPTVEQYKNVYRVLKLAHESQNEYANVGAGASST